MVHYGEQALDATFSALGDPTRRALVARLTGSNLSVSELAQPFPMSLQAVIKHLDVLAGAGLITRSKTGRTVSCELNATPIEQAREWIEGQQRAWNSRFDRLEAYLERIQRGAVDERES
jgi:DNA-binding transcriptional ArsR family regulator